MRMMTKQVLLAVTVLLLMVPSFMLGDHVPASVTLSGADCASCQGVTFTLTVEHVSGSTYNVTLVADTTGFTPDDPSITNISAVSFKVSNSLDSISLVSAPGGTSGWSSVMGMNINNMGCDGSGSGFGCAENTTDPFNPDLAPTDANEILTWEWQITTDSEIFALLDGAHIGAKFNNDAGTLQGQIVSEEVAVPEPSSLILLGAQLLVLGLLYRRIPIS